jgi:hypothetical protein
MITPVLVLAYRRPHTLRQVIDALRPVAPPVLFLACDGPHPERPAEESRVQEVRDLLESAIDWPCEVHRRFSPEHLGARRGVSGAISWFFAHVDQGIILEDDCVPDPTFFPFCEELLARYANDLRLWCITGGNYQDGRVRGEGSYYFSRYPHCWGWATWRSRWEAFDDEMASFEAFEASGLIQDIFSEPLEAAYWLRLWRTQYAQPSQDIWDYQWSYTCMSARGLTAVPNSNLITNVGDGPDATHTAGSASLNIPAGPLSFPLVHPHFELRDEAADRYTFEHFFPGRYLRYQQSLRGQWIDPVLARVPLLWSDPGHYPRKLAAALKRRMSACRHA